jgi:hypothetical protein
MTAEIVEPRDIDEALAMLTSLSQEFPRTEFVFRGQQDSQWRLCTSYDRYWAGKPPHDEFFVRRMVAQFRSGITRLGLETSLGNDQLAWLEYARHHGLPAPYWTSPGRRSWRFSSLSMASVTHRVRHRVERCML